MFVLLNILTLHLSRYFVFVLCSAQSARLMNKKNNFIYSLFIYQNCKITQVNMQKDHNNKVLLDKTSALSAVKKTNTVIS